MRLFGTPTVLTGNSTDTQIENVEIVSPFFHMVPSLVGGPFPPRINSNFGCPEMGPTVTGTDFVEAHMLGEFYRDDIPGPRFGFGTSTQLAGMNCFLCPTNLTPRSGSWFIFATVQLPLGSVWQIRHRFAFLFPDSHGNRAIYQVTMTPMEFLPP